MMSNTPRVFVGTTTFLIASMTSRIDLQTIAATINGFPGMRVVAADHNGLLTVNAERPVNRAALTDAIIQAGYTVLE